LKQHACPSCKELIKDIQVPRFLMHGICDKCILKSQKEARKKGIIIEYWGGSLNGISIT
jgi:hypothetical protein